MEAVLEVSQYITVIGAAIALVYKCFKFFSSLDRQLKEINKKLTNDNERIEDLQTQSRHLCVMMIHVCNHMITGNDIETLKQTRDNILEYMEKGGGE